MYYIKGNRIIKNLIASICALLVFTMSPLFFSCTAKNDTASETGMVTGENSNIFDARKVSAGDMISGLRIESVTIEPGADTNDKDNYFAIVKFSGSVTLSGKYISYSDQPLLGRSILFYPDKKSQELLPRLKQEPNDVWLVFENYDTAVGLLSQPDSEGEATIIIDNYTINYALEVVHTANITEVLNKNITKEPSLEPTDSAETPGTETQETTPERSNLFDARLAEPGDIIENMKITFIEVTQNVADKNNYSAVVKFSGEVQVSGTFRINQDDEFLDNLVSFIPDEESSAKLPKLSHDTRYAWFVFDNTDKAKEVFRSQGLEGMATIIIENYTINYAPAEVYNTAVLTELVARG